MNDGELSEWVVAWAARYDTPADAPVEALDAPARLDRVAWGIVATWKFQSMPHRRTQALNALAGVPDESLEDVSAAARAQRHDGWALAVITVLPRVGPGLGSSALTWMDPERFTVYDERAWRSAKVLGAELPPSRHPPYGMWVAECRKLAGRAGVGLRQLDRALFAAKGQRGLP